MPRVSKEYTDARRKQIIDAAYRCFARKGLHRTTMRDIYEETKLSPGAVYNYFESKDEIIEASFAFDHERSMPVFADALDEPDPMVALDNLLDFFYEGLESAAEIGADRVNIQGWSEALLNPRLLAPLQQSFDHYRELLARIVRRAQEAGAVSRAVDPGSIAEVVVSSYLGLYLQKAWNPGLDVDRYKESFKALLHGSFRTGLPES